MWPPAAHGAMGVILKHKQVGWKNLEAHIQVKKILNLDFAMMWCHAYKVLKMK
jgi:hypothetical protein